MIVHLTPNTMTINRLHCYALAIFIGLLLALQPFMGRGIYIVVLQYSVILSLASAMLIVRIVKGHESISTLSILVASALGMSGLGAISLNPVTISGGGLALGLSLVGLFIISRWLFYNNLASIAFLAGLLMLAFLTGQTILEFGVSAQSLNEVLPRGSRNALLFYLLAFSLGYVTAAYVETNKLHMWPALAVLLLAIVAGTRGPVLTAIVFAGAVVAFRISFLPKRRYVLFGAVSIAIGVSLFIFHFGGAIYETTKFANKGFETPRFQMWQAYLEALTGGSVMFGQNIEGVPLVANTWGGNPHSAFIKFHSHFGIIPLFLLLFTTLILVSFKSAGYAVASIAAMILLMRGITDINLVGTSADMVFVYLLVLLSRRVRLVPANVSTPKNTVHRALLVGNGMDSTHSIS